jgi:hypothetical protein
MMDAVDREEMLDMMLDILRKKVQKLINECPDVNNVHIWRWFRERWVYLKTNDHDEMVFKINSVNVWDNPKLIVEAFEFWGAIERSFIRKQLQLDRRMTKAHESIMKIKLDKNA